MIEDDDGDNTQQEPLKASKSQRKREAEAALELARQLVALDPSRFEAIELPQAVREAVIQTRRIRSHVARKRQLHFLAKQIRKSDTDAAQKQLERIDQHNAHAKQQFHEVERWRDRLIHEDNSALEAFIDAHPHVDRQQLRQHVARAQRELNSGKPPRDARKLFRFLREVLSDSSRVGPADGQ